MTREQNSLLLARERERAKHAHLSFRSTLLASIRSLLSFPSLFLFGLSSLRVFIRHEPLGSPGNSRIRPRLTPPRVVIRVGRTASSRKPHDAAVLGGVRFDTAESPVVSFNYSSSTHSARRASTYRPLRPSPLIGLSADKIEAASRSPFFEGQVHQPWLPALSLLSSSSHQLVITHQHASSPDRHRQYKGIQEQSTHIRRRCATSATTPSIGRPLVTNNPVDQNLDSNTATRIQLAP